MAQPESAYGFSLSWYPRYETTWAQFVGPDPWRSGAGAQWTVDRYAMNLRADQPFNLGGQRPAKGHGGLVVGLTAEDGSYHILPVFLRDLWLQGRIADQALPDVLHRVEAPLALRHYTSVPRMLLRMLGMAFVCAGVLVAAMAVVLWLSGRPDLSLVALEGALCFQLLGPVQWLVLRVRERAMASKVVGPPGHGV